MREKERNRDREKNRKPHEENIKTHEENAGHRKIPSDRAMDRQRETAKERYMKKRATYRETRDTQK